MTRPTYERNAEKKAMTFDIGIGETVLWRKKKVGRASGKLTVLWEDGIFCGGIGEVWEWVIGDGSGGLPKIANLVGHQPRRTGDEDQSADAENPQVLKLEALAGRRKVLLRKTSGCDVPGVGATDFAGFRLWHVHVSAKDDLML